jgi:hypothetical protein
VIVSAASRGAAQHATTSTHPDAWFAWIAAGFGALLVGTVSWASWQKRVATRALMAAWLDIARGAEDRGRAVFVALTTRRNHPLVEAWAHLALGELAERRAAWGDVIEHCDKGIARFTRSPPLRASDSGLYAGLIAVRAFALAATDRVAEADAEETILAKVCPTFALSTRTRFRQRLMKAVRAGALDDAADVARTRVPDLPLSLREDMLADVVVAATATVSFEERERIDAELRDDTELRAWIDAVAPGLRDRLRARVHVEEAHREEVLDEATEERAEDDGRRYFGGTMVTHTK